LIDINNRRRKEVWGAAVDKLRSLLLKALDTVEKAIEEGDAKVAIEVLRMAGMDMTKGGGTLGTYLIGADDPEQILEEITEKKALEERLRVFPPPTDWEKKKTLHELEELARKLEGL